MNLLLLIGWPWFERSSRGESIRKARLEASKLKTKAASGTNGCRRARVSLRDARHAQLSAEMGVAL